MYNLIREIEKGQQQMKARTYRLYIGCNDKDTKHQELSNKEIERRIDKYTLQRFNDYTITQGRGCWKGGQEHTYIIEIITANKRAIKALGQELEIAINQEEVLITETKTKTL